MSTDGLTYDTGALIAAERSDRLLWSLHRAALVRGLPRLSLRAYSRKRGEAGPSRNYRGCSKAAWWNH